MSFFHPPSHTQAGSLAILHLKKDSLVPVTLLHESNEGYAEGPVTNTRFGSFPHSTLVGVEWGSQVRASKVDTGAKGRKPKSTKDIEVSNGKPATEPGEEKKRKADDEVLSDEQVPKKLKQSDPASSPLQVSLSATPPVLQAGSGFVHILPPTPEAWTSSLSHRTQVVYIPDYSYILQRLRVRPGDSIIEAGAGSGSFTHAAARAVFNGSSVNASKPNTGGLGRVYSFEYHLPRVETLRAELESHGLRAIVRLTHRDVCTNGFVPEATYDSPAANAVFLDLPAPWLAIKHLSRSLPQCPLSATRPVHLCAFSPCIEQVMATVAMLRKLGWVEIDMVEVANRRIDVRREQVGLKNEGLRGMNASAASVEEAIDRLREVESKFSDFHAASAAASNGEAGVEKRLPSKAERLEKVKRDAERRKLYQEGQLAHRTEPEVKTHTSYLVFATLPRDWTESEEEACVLRWGKEADGHGNKSM